ncbi:MAG: hypothetical protein PWR13_1424 [Archaeoglobi archaeon]|nr:hypothetical protein [Candidatus Mnemosynella sp.]MBC7115188.1 hypothetical protein [Candidatus Mnemosynella bozhongmuii]MDI3502294.1 hypothetical protein [Archaeoglobi archaeon]MDK2782396.1 hypothetical protein [Archaeoglobi archaeon]
MSEENGVVSWIHYALTSTMPVQLCEVFFREDDVLLLYYGRHTLVTMAMKIPKRIAKRMRIAISVEGLKRAREIADEERVLKYEEIEEVILFGGSRKKDARKIPLFALRPRITIKTKKGKIYAFGIHDEEFDYERVKEELEELARRKGFKITVK